LGRGQDEIGMSDVERSCIRCPRRQARRGPILFHFKPLAYFRVLLRVVLNPALWSPMHSIKPSALRGSSSGAGFDAIARSITFSPTAPRWAGLPSTCQLSTPIRVEGLGTNQLIHPYCSILHDDWPRRCLWTRNGRCIFALPRETYRSPRV